MTKRKVIAKGREYQYEQLHITCMLKDRGRVEELSRHYGASMSKVIRLAIKEFHDKTFNE